MPECSCLPHPNKPAHVWLHCLWWHGDAWGVSPPYRPAACVDLVCKSPNVPSTWLGVTGWPVTIPQLGSHCSALQSTRSPYLHWLPKPSQHISSPSSPPTSCLSPPCVLQCGVSTKTMEMLPRAFLQFTVQQHPSWGPLPPDSSWITQSGTKTQRRRPSSIPWLVSQGPQPCISPTPSYCQLHQGIREEEGVLLWASELLGRHIKLTPNLRRQ